MEEGIDGEPKEVRATCICMAAKSIYIKNTKKNTEKDQTIIEILSFI